MRSLKWVLPFLLILGAINACGPSAQFVGGKNNPHPIRSLVSLTPASTEMALMYCARIPLLGRTEADNFPLSVRPIPVVMSGIRPNFEKIADMRPDGAIFQKGLIGEGDVEKLKSLGIQPISIGGNTYDEWRASLAKLGAATNAETELAEYLDRVSSNIQKVRSNISGKSLKVAFILPGASSEHMIEGTDGFFADVLNQVGAKPVGPKGTIFVKLNAEELLKENPDVILVAGNPNDLAKDPRLLDTTAFKKRNVFGLKPDIALREGSRVDLLVNDIGEALVQAK